MSRIADTSQGGGALRYAWIVAVVIAALLVGSVFAARDADATTYDAEELRVLRLINDYRQNNGLEPLLLSDTLSVASERHSEDMGERDFFAHNTASSSYYPAGAEPWDRMEAEGYTYNTYKGENIAAGYDTAEEAFQAWRDSPSHNAAMLDGNYRVVGVGRVNVPGSGFGWYWTTDFGAKVDPTAHEPGEEPPAEEPSKQQKRKQSGPVKDLGDLENGALDSRAVWRQEARDGAELIVDGHARLGGYNDGQDDLRQKIRVGPDTRLSYRLKITADEPEPPSDRLLVRLTNEEGRQLGVLERYTDADAADEWRRDRVNLSRFAGETVYLSFYVETDARHLTTFYVDDVGLERD
ncbi:MAG TPA: CAP domain-containing protein [Rubrobacteraceae bacterium]|nr:CAP domain-containing protein [Rubrobacteraceae bacterium]